MMEKVITELVTKDNSNVDDYIKDGLRYCAKCNTPKQHRVSLLGKEMIVPCMCDCRSEEYAREETERETEDKLKRLNQIKTSSLQDKSYRNCDFKTDNGKNPKQMAKAKKYVNQWEIMYKENCGLLLLGDVGTGKTFFAACIANELINRSVPVLMTNFSAIISEMGFDYNEYLKELKNYKLLILDDLGVERQSEYMMEKIYNIIDSRYRDKQPVIITTNLSIKELKEPQNIEYRRIYDRVLEMCVPIQFKGESRRKEAHESKKDKLRAIFE